jgi:DNA modification methylase
VQIMSEIIRKYGLNVLDMAKELGRSIGCERVEVKGSTYIAVNNDCVEETKRMESDSVHLIHTSIPFSNHYEYSPSYNDFGHNTNNDSFFKQMDFLTPELLRVLKPGRVAAIHVKDRVLFGNVTGYGMPSMDPFHVDCIQHYRKHGFIYFGMITVVTDVVRENNQTYRLGWTEQCKDGSKMGVGCPEYILLFRKLPTDTSRAYADEPVKKSKEAYSRARWQTDAHAFWRSSGDRHLTTDEITKYPVDVIGKMFEKWTLENLYDYEAHVHIGEHLDAKGVLPSTFMLLDPASHNQDVWHDVNRMLTLNSNQRQRNMTNHICPLQHDIVTRIIERYSNKGDVVYDPFGGLMTVPYNAVKLGRFGIGCELNPEYFKDGLSYLNAADREIKIPSLFDFERAIVKEAA